MQTMSLWQRILLWSLLAGSLVMAASLLYMRERAERRLADAADAYPISAPNDAPAEPVTLEIASDADGSITPLQATMTLPAESHARVRALLERLMDEYGQPQSPHPLHGGAAVDEVFLLDISDERGHSTGTQMAVVNLHGGFVDAHPSGIAVESLTLLSIAATLHDNMPGIAQVRFLVDGQQRDTLAGHADLTHVYLTSGMPVTPPASK